MRVRFWGTRGSIAKAGPATVRYGGNTSCVEVRSSSGTVVILDCGTGAHGLGHSLLEEDVPGGHILISHTHWDHIQGFPFFSPLFLRNRDWRIFGPQGLGATLRETLSGQMRYTYFPVTLEQLEANVQYSNLVEGTFEIGDIQVTARYLNHPAITLGYRLEADGVTVVYATDHEPHDRALATGGRPPAGSDDQAHAAFLSGADLIIHDSQYTAAEYPSKAGWGHSTVEYAVASAAAGGAARLALYHHDPLRDDVSLDRVVAEAKKSSTGPLEVFAAAEGQTIELARVDGPARAAGGQIQISALRLPEADLGGSAILLAVSDAACLSSLDKATEADDLSVRIVDSPGDALDALCEDRPPVILAEHDPPTRDALALCRAIRAEEGSYAPDATVIAVARPEHVDREAGREAQLSDWMLMPFSAQYARTRIEAWLLRTACRWARARKPRDEGRRLAALHGLEILDSDPEERFDRYTRIASALFRTPISLVTLIDAERQWFKSARGPVGLRQTHRDMAFCAHAILQPEILEVADTHLDPRFADNPLVTGEPFVRFYAGAPLALPDGSVAGTLCLMDERPRRLTERQEQLLRDLADLVELELARTMFP